MEIINKSKFDILISEVENLFELSPPLKEVNIFTSNSVFLDDEFHYLPLNFYLKINIELILIKKITEFCNKIIIKDSLIENEVEVEIIK